MVRVTWEGLKRAAVPTTSGQPGAGALSQTLLVAFGVWAACYAGNELSATFRFPQIGTALLYPPYAILTAALVLSPPGRWWIYLLAAFAAHFLPHWRHWPLTWIVLADVANLARALCAAIALRRFCGVPPRVSSLQGMLVFVLVAALVAPALGAFIGAGVVVLHGGATDYSLAWTAWFLSNALTGLTLLPMILTGIQRPWKQATPGRVLEAGLLSAGLVAVGALFFGEWAGDAGLLPARLYAPLPFLLWAAVRFGPGGTAASLLAIAFLAIWGGVHGNGPFITEPPGENMVSLQLFLIAASIPLMCLAAVVQERAQHREALEERLRFEGLLSELSAEFASRPAEEIDGAIEHALGRIGEFLGADKTSQWEVTPEGASCRTHFWTASGVDPAPFWVMPDLVQRLARRVGEKGSLSCSIRGADRAICEDLRVRSFLLLPLRAGGQVVGGLTFSSRVREQEWPEDLVQRLQVAAGIFASAVARRRDDEAVREGEEALRQSHGENRALAGRLIAAAEEERRRVARDLHDNVCQQLAFLCITASRLKQSPALAGADEAALVARLREGLGDVTDDIREFSHRLHPALLEMEGLVTALGSLADEVRTHPLDVRLTLGEDLEPVPPDAALCLFRVAQEGLQNVVRHSGAAGAEVILVREPGALSLTIRDSGKGFDPEAAREAGGLGLMSMAERVRLLDGTLTIRSRPGAGTELSVRIPAAFADYIPADTRLRSD